MTLEPHEAKGHADLRLGDRGYTLRRTAIVAVAAAAFVVGLTAASAVLLGEVDPGVVTEEAGGRILAVSPTGFAWREGIRPGQLVLAVARADDPAGWRIETTDSGGTFSAASAGADVGLRASLPLAVGALAFGALAVLLLGARRQWVLPAAAIGLLLGSTPLLLQGNPVLSTFAMGSATSVPVAWGLSKLHVRREVGAGVSLASAVAIAVWALSRLGGWSSYDGFEWIRATVAVFGTALLVFDRTAGPRLAGEPFQMIRPRSFDVAAIALLVGVALVLVYFVSVPPVAAAILAVFGALLLPVVRSRIGFVEHALLADVRRHAAVEGAEAERARLARELHDVPLQELIGILRRLEVLPGAEHESDDLRAVAGHLRDVAMDLRPPVLDDLGLPAALEYLAEGTTTSDLPVTAQVDASTGLTGETRPPEDVELAIFRIAAEAVSNAVRHASASAIDIRAHVDPRRVDVEVTDNGRGLGTDALRQAGREKHLGLASMRRRAEAIDADLTVRTANPGTLVHVVWEA